MINLLLLVNALLRHGPGLVVHSIASRLDESAFRVIVVSLDQPDISLSADLESRNVRVIQLSRGRNRLRALAQIILDHETHVLHTHGLRADVIGRTTGKFLRVPVVLSTIHDAPGMYQLAQGPVLGTLELAAQVLTLHFVDIAVIVAGIVGQAYIRILPFAYFSRRLYMIHNGVPDCYLPRYEGVEEGIQNSSIAVGTVGRLTPWKGLQFLLEAAAQVISMSPRVKFLVVGDGESRIDLENHVRTLGLQDSFCFAGHQPNVAGMLRDIDIFVLPSLIECLPLAVLEAMSAGKAIVASNVGGISEAIVPEETGILVPPANADALACALRQVIDDKGLRERLGGAARRRYLEHFRVDNMVSRYRDLYFELVERKQKK